VCVGTPDAQLGLPELTLGIIPGFGGTQRLPRLVGIQKGLQMILTSKPLKAEAALKSGLVDAIVSKGELLQAAKKMALGMAGGKVQRRKTLQLTDK
jgi:enoyl-CoA hydratase/3-hydroxyacyl-CoA dehydrogenase